MFLSAGVWAAKASLRWSASCCDLSCLAFLSGRVNIFGDASHLAGHKGMVSIAVSTVVTDCMEHTSEVCMPGDVRVAGASGGNGGVSIKPCGAL